VVMAISLNLLSGGGTDPGLALGFGALFRYP
jgi:hypothetical protein